jgi:YesN/AraC family two-component response regulator
MTTIQQKKILIVDDEINVCKSIRRAILSEHYAVDTALSGEEALTMQEQNGYDMLITDLMMPGISGVELLTSFKVKFPEVILIMITGYPTIKTAVQAIKLGAFDYIPKPFTPDELRGLVERAFRQSEAQKSGEDVPAPPRPQGLFYLRGQTWLRKEGTNAATVGLVYDFIKNIEPVTSIDILAENKRVYQGESCARFTDARGYIHRIWSPASGRISRINETLLQDFSLLLKDPYGAGWILTLETTDLAKDLEGLIPG